MLLKECLLRGVWSLLGLLGRLLHVYFVLVLFGLYTCCVALHLRHVVLAHSPCALPFPVSMLHVYFVPSFVTLITASTFVLCTWYCVGAMRRVFSASSAPSVRTTCLSLETIHILDEPFLSTHDFFNSRRTHSVVGGKRRYARGQHLAILPEEA